eukprot:COSAG04_NODE_552_length_12696_cov_3.047154_1_plen_502_part_00
MGGGRKRGGRPTGNSTPSTEPAAAPSWWLPLALAAGVGAVIWALGWGGAGAQMLGWGGAGAPAEGGAALSGSMMPCEGRELEAPTPLMRAAMMGDADTTRQLAQSGRGGHPNACVTGGLTALHFALNGRMNQMQDDRLVRELRGAHEDCVAQLLAAGADPMVGHLSALWYAASFRNYEVLALTARAGADVNDRADGGWSLLHEVSASKASGMARFFMKPEIDPKILALMRLQPLSPLAHPSAEPFNLPRLQAACTSDDVSLLIEQGAEVDWADEKGRTALHIAAGDAVLPAVEALLGAGADPNLAGPDGATALHRAAGASHDLTEAVVGALLAAGADPSLKDDYGRAPAVVAVSPAIRLKLSTGQAAQKEAEVADEEPLEPEPELEAAAAAAGWSVARVGLGEGGRRRLGRRCDFDVVEASEMDNARFRRDYLSRRRPVLIKRGAARMVEEGRWTRANLTALLRKHKVQLAAGQVPYAAHYGIAEKPAGIRAYLGAMESYE